MQNFLDSTAGVCSAVSPVARRLGALFLFLNAALFLMVAIGPVAVGQSVQMTAIQAGHLVDPATGTSTPDQIILVERNNENGRGTIVAIGSDVRIPDGAEVIDLSDQYVLGGQFHEIPERRSSRSAWTVRRIRTRPSS